MAGEGEKKSTYEEVMEWRYPIINRNGNLTILC